ncbi:MAG: class I SAM-dependent methyltransferase [Bryobacteraceae bacterium]
MRNHERWRPTKYVFDSRGKAWVANPGHIVAGSRYIAGLQIVAYERVIRQYARGRLLDCGCGRVPYYGIYRDLVTDNVCVDWENSPHSNEFVDESVDLNGTLPFPERSFDTVLLSDVLEHIAEPKRLIGEISRVLRPGGCLLLMVPFLYYIHEQPFDFYRYTEFALRRFCDDSGLEVVELSQYGGWVDVLFDLINKTLIRHEWSVALYLRVGAWIQGTRKYRRIRASSMAFPLGYCLAARKKPDA